MAQLLVMAKEAPPAPWQAARPRTLPQGGAFTSPHLLLPGRWTKPLLQCLEG